MGNTNIPQFGAADADNSRDTLTGDRQLTAKQKQELDKQLSGGLEALLPDSVANESTSLVEHADHGRNIIGKRSSDEGEALPTEHDLEVLAGHVGTGHSPSGAT
jgi:hypothetical protein